MYRYTFIFKLKLTTTILQKVAIFYMMKYGMDQNILHCCMVTMQLRISKMKLIKHAGVILHPYHVILFSRTCQSLLVVTGFP